MKALHRIALVSAACMPAIAALPLHAETCKVPPLFDMGGPTCEPSRQGTKCACSECVQWDVVAGARWYEIRRCDRSGANCTIVGDTRWRNRAAFTDPQGVVQPEVRPTEWCVAWDSPFPATGASYDYTVRSCTDGASGPICSGQFSNPVGYATAPYMCIEKEVEIACSTSASPRPFATDLDGDGLTDAVDTDDDGDDVVDVVDNCPRTVNIGRRDADGDGVGDACDPQPLVAGSGPADADNDGIGDRVDVCPTVHDPLQADADRDRTGDACDNCPSTFNDAQTDTDGDHEGDLCDLDDGTLHAAWSSRSRMAWDQESPFATWCVYRGDLAELRRSGTYTQLPSSNPLAARFCDLPAASLDDTTTPAPGATAFHLVAGRPGSWSTELGVDSEGNVRPNTNTCP